MTDIKDYGTGNQPTGQTWDTTQLQQDFEVRGFSAPYVAVTRRSDGKQGLLEFQHRPRVYFNWMEV